MQQVSATQERDGRRVHISKALAWVLRHSPKRTKNGEVDLEFFKGGYVPLVDVLALPTFHTWTEKDILDAIEHSISNVDHVTSRFEHVDVEGRTYIRARYGHTFAVDTYPPLTSATTLAAVTSATPLSSLGRHPKRLYKICVAIIAKHLKSYDSLHDVIPDPFVLWDVFLSAKKHSKLTNTTLRLFLNPVTDRLDLSDCYLSDSMLQKIAKECPSLTSLNLKGNAAVVTNNSLQFILRRQTSLASLGLGECRYLTDAVAPLIGLSCPRLTTLDMSGCSLITDPSLLTIASKCSRLTHIYLSHCSGITEEGVSFATRKPLQTLDIGWNKQLRGDVVASVLAKSESAKSLRDLNVAAIDTLTESLLLPLLTSLPALRNINVRGIEKITMTDYHRIESAFPHLRISIGKSLDPTTLHSDSITAVAPRPSTKKRDKK